MSDDQSEIDNLRNMLIELSKKVDSNLVNPENTITKGNTESINDSGLYLEANTLQNEIEELSLKNKLLQQEINTLKTEKTNLEYENNKNTKKKDYYAKQIEQHEKKNRELFELYSIDKEELFNYRLLTEKLKQEIVSLENNIDKQEQRYENLKNQLSYKLGSRLIGLKKSKDLLKLPKHLLDDYVSVKSKVNNSSASLSVAQKSPQVSQPIYNSNREYTIFNKSVTLPLKRNSSTIIFSQGFKGSLDLQLYGVKPSATVEIELTIRAHQSDSIFKVIPDFKHVQHLSANEAITINITVNDDQAHQFIQVISASGAMEVSFKKTRGVPSFIHLFQVQNSDVIEINDNYEKSIVDKTDIVNKKLTNRDNIYIPELGKKSWIFRQAVEVQDKYGFAVANAFLKKYVNEEHKNTINIFHANNSLNDEKLWLSYINNYIGSYDMQPISLNDKKSKDIFFRLYSSVDYKVEDSTKITVIMPAYNAEKTIKHSIKSILCQTWKNIELIVINDCSNDSTLTIIEKLALTDSRIKVINNPLNVGAYVSKNLGLKVATGKYITGHDADDWAFPQRLEHHMMLIRAESVPPRASNTRMIRMEKNGYLPLYPFGAFCQDGVMRVASITCMFEANFLRDTLGAWDCSRFGADSEIINRCKMVIGDEFKNYQALSMICLDEPTSLTNHPIHGVSKSTGISPSRKFYKEQWVEWHKKLSKNNVYLDFPHFDRNFDVPEGTEIPKENIIRAIQNVNKLQQ